MQYGFDLKLSDCQDCIDKDKSLHFETVYLTPGGGGGGGGLNGA